MQRHSQDSALRIQHACYHIMWGAKYILRRFLTARNPTSLSRQTLCQQFTMGIRPGAIRSTRYARHTRSNGAIAFHTRSPATNSSETYGEVCCLSLGTVGLRIGDGPNVQAGSSSMVPGPAMNARYRVSSGNGAYGLLGAVCAITGNSLRRPFGQLSIREFKRLCGQVGMWVVGDERVGFLREASHDGFSMT